MRTAFVLAAAGLCIGVSAEAAPAASYLFYQSFDTPVVPKQLAPSPDGNATARVETGAVRIDLDRYRDAIPYRTELVPKQLPATVFDDGKKPRVGLEYWYGLSIEVPVDWVVDNSYEVVTQWHGNTTGAPVSLRMDSPSDGAGLHGSDDRAERWLLMIDAGVPRVKFDIGPVADDMGKKIDWVFRIRWSPDASGHLTVWRNKHKVVDYMGPTMFREAQGPYWKFGIYKSPWKQVPDLKPVQAHRALRFDSVRIGQNARIGQF